MPFFKKLIDQGATELPITDARMTRFLITLQQGVNFVLSSMAMMRGGEIFVPKIPSMKITDVATAIAPHLPQKIVGIRPGEKLHEVMITEEDSWSTVELADRYVIEPSHIRWEATRGSLPGAKPVEEGFYYNSRNNHDWMSGERLLELLAAE
jgi:UDP-N-acetylglucosamine 4,6-dehydratase